jgi:hypothetical protein
LTEAEDHMDEHEASPLLTHSLTESAQRAIRASKDHQYALKLYTERLEAELQTVDKLLVCYSLIQSFQCRYFIAQKAADYLVQDDEPELDGGGFILVPGSKKAVGLLRSAELISQVHVPFHCMIILINRRWKNSPFYSDSQVRSRFLEVTSAHPSMSSNLVRVRILSVVVSSEGQRARSVGRSRSY